MSATVTRSQILEAVKILGLDPNAVLELHIFPESVQGEEIVKTLDGTDNKMGKVTMESDRHPRHIWRARWTRGRCSLVDNLRPQIQCRTPRRTPRRHRPRTSRQCPNSRRERRTARQGRRPRS